MGVDISVSDSPLAKALDVYYSWLLEIANSQREVSSDQKLLLNNTIIPFDISVDTKYYNEGLFRNFSDRVFKSSPQSITPASRADRFSGHYRTLISQAASSIDRKYNKIITELTAIRNEINTKTNELRDLIIKIEKDWQQIGISPDDPSYEMRYLSYLEKIRYADQVGSLSDDIDSLIGQIDSVRRSVYTADEQLILDTLTHLSKTSLIARPRRPSFERTVPNVNELTFADPTVRIEALCDISPSIFPLGDLIKFLTLPGTKDISITKSSTAKSEHDSTWSAGGSARYGFFNIGGSGGGESHYKEDIQKTNSIYLYFENLSEYLVDRDLWFNPIVFEKPDLLKQFKQIGGLERFEYISISLIIARGLKLELKFDTEINIEQWSKRRFNASGGVSAFGFSFGASGSNSSYDYTLEISKDKRTVTFKDDPGLTRVLAYRLDPFVKIQKGLLGDSEHNKTINEDLRKYYDGQINYLELQKSKFR